MLKDTYKNFLGNYTTDKELIAEFWAEIEKYYLAKNRYYHNLEHLENLLIQLTEIKDKIQHWESIFFALYYHDIIYYVLKSDNEQASAVRAEKRMSQLGVASDSIRLSKKHILATQSHLKSKNQDTNYFTDADLSILGQPWEIYSNYYKNVRKEYSLYPDFLYNPGRKKALTHFLEMERIFKTDYFFDKFEAQAKENIRKEIELL